MIIVTGGLGFIGSNLVKRLNKDSEVIIVDKHSEFKIKNVKGLEIKDFFEKKNFIRLIKKNNFNFKNITHIFHLGACTNTAEKDKKYLYENNFLYSKDLLKFSNNNNIKFIYASSASIYGNINSTMKEDIFSKKPLNLYAWSKVLFDQFVLKNKKKLKNTIGLRYFNVHGNNEFHKSKMCSPVLSFYEQLKKNKYCKIFKNYGGKYSIKDWGINNWIKLIEKILKYKKNSKILLIGSGKNEKKYCEKINMNFNNKLELFFDKPIKKLINKMLQAKLYLGHDTANMHLASILKIRTVAIFSSTQLEGVWYPLGNGNLNFYKKISCSNCQLTELCPFNKKCINSFMPNFIFKKIRSLL